MLCTFWIIIALIIFLFSQLCPKDIVCSAEVFCCHTAMLKTRKKKKHTYPCKSSFICFDACFLNVTQALKFAFKVIFFTAGKTSVLQNLRIFTQKEKNASWKSKALSCHYATLVLLWIKGQLISSKSLGLSFLFKKSLREYSTSLFNVDIWIITSWAFSNNTAGGHIMA